MTDLIEETITNNISQATDKMITSFEEFSQRGSGWSLEKINKLELHVLKYHPLAGNTYIPLPKNLSDKKAVLNIQNDDAKCLVWCLIAKRLNIDRKDNPYKIEHYLPHESSIKLGDVECPVPISKVSTIENLNNVRINVLGYERGEIFPRYISKRSESNCVNLLLISTHHYCLIRNMSRLLGDVTARSMDMKPITVFDVCMDSLEEISQKVT